MTRGRIKINKSITLTGRVYLLEDDELSPVKGDLALSPTFNEKRVSSYYIDQTGYSGYFRIFVFDRNIWGAIKIDDFFENKEHHFSKTERPIDKFHYIKDILIDMTLGKNIVVNKTYRDHYSTYTHEMNEYKGKKGHFDKKNKRSLQKVQ